VYSGSSATDSVRRSSRKSELALHLQCRDVLDGVHAVSRCSITAFTSHTDLCTVETKLSQYNVIVLLETNMRMP
jgi:hypothetical protein